jgi:hypothetical protein
MLLFTRDAHICGAHAPLPPRPLYRCRHPRDKPEAMPYTQSKEAARMPDASPAIVAIDQDGIPLDVAVKGCEGEGFVTLRRWLGTNDAVFLCNRRHLEPMVVLTFSAWNRLANMTASRMPER